MRFWRNTSVASYAGQVATLPDGTLGYEWDADVDNGFRPAGPAAPLDDDRRRARSAAGLWVDTTDRRRRPTR